MLGMPSPRHAWIFNQESETVFAQIRDCQTSRLYTIVGSARGHGVVQGRVELCHLSLDYHV